MIRLTEKNTPRWIIFCFDVTACIGSLILAYLLRFNFHIPKIEIERFGYVFTTLITVRAATFLVNKTYAGIIRYTSTKDAQRIFFNVLIGSLAFIVINFISYGITKIYMIPFSIVIIDFITTSFLLIAARVIVKTLYMEIRNPSRKKSDVVIYGAGESGVITKRSLDRDKGTRYKVIAFLDDDPKKAGMTLEGVEIFNSAKDFDDLLRTHPEANLIISIQNISPQRKQEIIEKCLTYDTKVLNVPPVNKWINGELSFNQLRKIRIEELLERDPIHLDKEKIKHELKGKIILITGGAGSIGSEIVRQIIPFNPEKIIVVDQAESPIYELELEINERYGFKNLETVIGDVTKQDRMRRVFDAFHPQIVFHSAAYKHVPLMENNPSESIMNNVYGTKVLADLANQFNVEKFVMISTDKAVNPTNIMGATKRIAEIYCQSFNRASSTKFITTRFGNVLDSNGSVIPRFKKQIEEGGPVTVTHPDITRFFMTIPEACQLVLEAGAMGNGGEIFIFDMGKSVKILELARKMIQLSGLVPEKDIQITFSGLRPGEKIHEELLNDKEKTLPTHHSKIMIAKVREYDFKEIEENITALINLFGAQNNEAIVRKMKEIVPEFISHNSVYGSLDVKG